MERVAAWWAARTGGNSTRLLVGFIVGAIVFGSTAEEPRLTAGLLCALVGAAGGLSQPGPARG